MANILYITPAERAALQLLATGTPTDGIALHLGLSECEVNTQLASLFGRMGARDRDTAIAAARRRGLLTTGAETSGIAVSKRRTPTPTPEMPQPDA